MSEPEHAPDTPDHAAHAHPPVRILWWIYFALISIYWLLAVFGVHSLLDALQVAFWAVGLVGVWGYLRHLALGGRKFWMAYVPLFVLWVLGNITIRFAHAPQGSVWASLFASLGIALMFSLSAWALWRYAFRCPKIWRTSR